MKHILKGKILGNKIKLYLTVDIKNSQILFQRITLVKDLKYFEDWGVKKTYRDKYLIEQNFGIDFYTFGKIETVIDFTLNNFLK